jgi:hypothetical protein
MGTFRPDAALKTDKQTIVLSGSTRSVAFATAPRLAVLAGVPRYFCNRVYVIGI